MVSNTALKAILERQRDFDNIGLHKEFWHLVDGHSVMQIGNELPCHEAIMLDTLFFGWANRVFDKVGLPAD